MMLRTTIYNACTEIQIELSELETIRIYHQSPVRTEKNQAEGKFIMSKTRFTEFPALSVDPRLGFLGLHRRPMVDYFSYLLH